MRRAADFADEAADPRPVELRRHRGRQLARDDDHRRVQFVDQLHERIQVRAQITLQASADIGEVPDPLRQPRVAFAGEDIVQFLDRALEGPVRVDALAANERVGP